MNNISFALATSCLALAFNAAFASDGPQPASPVAAIATPQDVAFPGTLTLAVDATDTNRHIVLVRETIPVTGPDMVLLYPKWLPGSHAPEGTLARVAGLTITGNGSRINWTRDPIEVFAFHIQVPAGLKTLQLTFQYLAPTSEKVAPNEFSRDIMFLEWNALVFYPAGYFARQIPVSASLTIPTNWKFATALERTLPNGNTFKTTPLETLIDSPVYAGHYYRQIDLDPKGPAPVHLNLFADRPELLEAKEEHFEAHRSLVQQAYKLYGAHHYDHYDFLVSVSENIVYQGLEHHRSSEDGVQPTYFTEWDKTASERDLLPHEFTHSWNGKFRRPYDLWTADYSVPMRDSLLWVYEGQTEYWGKILAARSGLRTQQQAFDELALTAAYYANQPGRAWRSLQDTTNDEIINPRRPMPWKGYQRFEDYYDEGALIWLEADTLIRQETNDTHSLDDFAKAFFGINNGSYVPVTYTFDDVVRTLNGVMAYDWASFLRTRLDTVGRDAPLEGLTRGGYKLVYNDTPNDYLEKRDALEKETSLEQSLGMVIDKDDMFKLVVWGSPAFNAGLKPEDKIIAVNGTAYAADVLIDAIKTTKTSKDTIELIVKAGGQYRVVKIDYHIGLRYPHLERNGKPARLDNIYAAKK